MVFQILLNHLIDYRSRTPGTATDHPEMTSPIHLAYSGNYGKEDAKITPATSSPKYLCSRKRGGGKYSTCMWIWSLITTPSRIRTISESHIWESRSQQRYFRSPWRTAYLYFVAQTILQLILHMEWESYDNLTSHKAKKFIETKVTPINCRVLTFY